MLRRVVSMVWRKQKRTIGTSGCWNHLELTPKSAVTEALLAIEGLKKIRFGQDPNGPALAVDNREGMKGGRGGPRADLVQRGLFTKGEEGFMQNVSHGNRGAA